MRAYWLADADEPSARVRAGPRGPWMCRCECQPRLDPVIPQHVCLGRAQGCVLVQQYRVCLWDQNCPISSTVFLTHLLGQCQTCAVNIGNKCNCIAHQSCGTQPYQDRFAREIVTGCSIVFTVLKMWFNVSPQNLVKVAIFSQFIRCQWSSEPRSFQTSVSYFAYLGKKQ